MKELKDVHHRRPHYGRVGHRCVGHQQVGHRWIDPAQKVEVGDSGASSVSVEGTEHVPLLMKKMIN